MAVDEGVYHILTVTGFSPNSFDEAANNAVNGGWENHHEEFEKFVSYEVGPAGPNVYIWTFGRWNAGRTGVGLGGMPTDCCLKRYYG